MTAAIYLGLMGGGITVAIVASIVLRGIKLI
ncbi:MAG: cytochrome B6 [Synechococcus sp.]|nr:cytochrome B6 [Synechococcus sp.]